MSGEPHEPIAAVEPNVALGNGILATPAFSPQRHAFLAAFGGRFAPLLLQLDIASLRAAPPARITLDLHPSAAEYPLPFGSILAKVGHLGCHYKWSRL